MDLFLIPGVLVSLIGILGYLDLKKKNLMTKNLRYSFVKILIIGLVSANISIPIAGMMFGLWSIILASIAVTYFFSKELS